MDKKDVGGAFMQLELGQGTISFTQGENTFSGATKTAEQISRDMRALAENIEAAGLIAIQPLEMVHLLHQVEMITPMSIIDFKIPEAIASECYGYNDPVDDSHHQAKDPRKRAPYYQQYSAPGRSRRKKGR